MRIYFRTDASFLMGSGHVMRCLTLADQLRLHGVTICFICRALPGNLIEYIKNKGYQVYLLPYQKGQSETWLGENYQVEIAQMKEILAGGEKPDWLIVDHYALDILWESEMRSYVKRIMVIDDLADREHDCNILLDQNLYKDFERRYRNIIPVSCIRLLGPQYALLRPEFYAARQKAKVHTGKLGRIFICFGGSDPSNQTEKAMLALQAFPNTELIVDVVVGAINKNKEKIEQFCADKINFNYYCQVDNIAEVMLKADLAIGAGGTTTWERCALGLPAITLTLADNQKEINQYLNELGVIRHIGELNNVTSNDIFEQVDFLRHNSSVIKEISKQAFALMGECTGQTVIKYLLD